MTSHTGPSPTTAAAAQKASYTSSTLQRRPTESLPLPRVAEYDIVADLTTTLATTRPLGPKYALLSRLHAEHGKDCVDT